jgi:hypothetical protein
MQKKQVTWEDIVTKLDLFEHTMEKNIHDKFLEDFFISLKDDFDNNKFEMWQIEEAHRRTSEIIKKLGELKAQLQERSVTLLENSVKLKNYIASSNIL